MAGLWYRVGTVTLTNGSKAVVGYGTKWKSANPLPGKGSMLCGPDGKVYEVDTVADDNNLTLVSNYTGTSGAGQGYALVLMALTIPQFSTQLSQFVQKNSLFASQINTLLTATGDVNLTDPDSGLVIKAPSWSKIASEGEGQAARAKVEADRAKTEADRSGTEADRAAGIVAAAALPLPDVWAPLSDSLRLITGYGRDVLVGSDVVARMVNFSRSTTRTYTAKDGTLKQAAVNEPCFEKDGLHLDVQSQNIFIASDAIAAPSAASVSTSVVTDEGIAAFTSVISKTKVVRAIQTVNAPGNTITLQSSMFVAGKTYTASVWCRTDAGASIQFRLQPNGFSPPPIVVTGDKWARRSVTFTIPADYSSAGGLLFSINQGEYLGIPLYFTGLQVEELPWASSYIPTSGAAATRAADLLQFVGPGNHPDILSGVPFTLAVRMSCEEAASGAMRDMVLCPNISYGLLRRATNTIRYYRDGSGQLSVNAPAKTVNVVAVRVSAGNVCTLRVGSNQASRTEVPLSGGKVSTINITNVAGHVRDFRIWQHSLTDEQFKAIA